MNSFTNNTIFFELVKVNIIDRMRAVRTITENQYINRATVSVEFKNNEDTCNAAVHKKCN